MSALTPALLEAARFPDFDLPAPPEGYPFQIRTGDGYQVGFMPGTDYGMVWVRRLGERRLAECVAEVHELLAVEGFHRAAWVISEAAEPAGLVTQLAEYGLVPWEQASEGLEARHRCMVLAVEPAPAPDGVVARRVETFEEFVAGARVSHDVFELSEQVRQVFEQRQRELWEWQQLYPGYQSFIAYVDGVIAGNANAIFGANAAYMVGGSVRDDQRGRGAYRALVRARWDAALAAGTPALTVTAGSMSSPILERLGFDTVCWGDVLSDRFG